MIIKIAKFLTIVSFLNAFGVKENNYNIELNSSSQDGNYIIGDYSDYYEKQYCINKIQLDKARIIDRKYSEVKVGIIDNGVDVRNNVLSNYFDTNLNYEYLNNDHINAYLIVMIHLIMRLMLLVLLILHLMVMQG